MVMAAPTLATTLPDTLNPTIPMIVSKWDTAAQMRLIFRIRPC